MTAAPPNHHRAPANFCNDPPDRGQQ